MDIVLSGVCMKEYDFVFVYEGKNRELESVCLMACELEQRGYSVKILQTWKSMFWKNRAVVARVTIGHALYSTKTLHYIMSFVRECQKFVNMQWEQVFTNGDKEYDVTAQSSSVGVSGSACEACHFSWGSETNKRLTSLYNVSEKKTRVIGNVSLDFLLPQFDEFYMKREELCKRYDFPRNKKICLFISSFSYSGLPNSILNSDLYQNQSMDVDEFVTISVNSQKYVLNWFERFLEQNDEYIVVYRPHPAENDNIRLKQMERKYTNFYVISELSIKQWIKCTEKIFTWYSTAALEVYAAGKKCSILRPVDIPYKMDIELYNNGNYLKTYEQFEAVLLGEKECSIPIENIKRLCYINTSEPAYIRACNYLEEIYHNEIYNMNLVYEEDWSLVHRIKYNICGLVKKRKIILKILRKLFPKKFSDSRFNGCLYNLKMYKNNYATRGEIKRLKIKIKNCIKNR